MKYLNLKNELKKLAEKIRTTKNKLKEHQRENKGWNSGFFSTKDKLKFEFRHKHIAYCLLRGTDREKIENPAKDNLPDEDYIKEIINEHKIEDVCACA